METVKSAYQDRGVELEVDSPQDLPQVMADPGRIGHVFSNLLNNALKYTPPGGKVRLWAAAEDGTVRFSVRDNGPGIPTEYKSRIFEKFYRVPETVKHYWKRRIQDWQSRKTSSRRMAGPSAWKANPMKAAHSVLRLQWQVSRRSKVARHMSFASRRRWRHETSDHTNCR